MKRMDMTAACQRAVDVERTLIGTLRPEDLAKPTPCAEWNVRALVNHMIGVCLTYAAVFRGQPADSGNTPADLAGDRPADAYSRAAAALLAALQAPGAL